MAAPTELEIEANGLRFETLVAGPEEGQAVILLHGYPQSAASWQETMEWLDGRGYRAIAPDGRLIGIYRDDGAKAVPEIMAEFASDDQIRVVVLSGAGGKAR